MNPIKAFLCVVCCLSASNGMASGNPNGAPKHWALQASFGETTLADNTSDGQDFYIGDEKGNYFALSADYYLNPHLALTGNLYYEQDGIATQYASGIGLKKANMLGLEGGIKWYFCPQKWVVQPHIGGLIQTNFLNLKRMQGSETHVLQQAYPGSHVQMNYDVQCPAIALKPKIGVDIRIISSVSLCFAYDIGFGFGGHHRADMRFLDLPFTGQTCQYQADNIRTTVSLGLKIDFPTRPVSGKTVNNLFMILSAWLESKSQNRSTFSHGSF